MPKREKFDLNEYRSSVLKECFICNIVTRGNKRPEHPILFEDDNFIAFLNKYPTQVGQSLVAPKRHVSHIFSDFTEDEYLDLLACARKIGLAIQRATNADRMYLLSLGSNELNDHVHLHLFPLPMNTPLDQQQLVALDNEKNGFLSFTTKEKEALASSIRAQLGDNLEGSSIP